MNKEPTSFFFPDGRQFVQLTNVSGQWRAPFTGAHVAYVAVEHVEYAPTLGEQFLMQRGVSK